ncbi:hypothetical protein EVAR_22820_1 [Eumeta japonica]|uniref:Uncharacterized protein n=1 Tax=Eumeta variegata TaxID=151549 RepID=A0A4C1VE05_EUMVA|nr:hypothetical protein EVAR_22820_1 [Eumeta japonica]
MKHPGHILNFDPIFTFIFNPSPLLNVGPGRAFDHDSNPSLDFDPCSAFNFNSATSPNSDVDETQDCPSEASPAWTLNFLIFFISIDVAVNLDLGSVCNTDPSIASDFDPGPTFHLYSGSVHNFGSCWTLDSDSGPALISASRPGHAPDSNPGSAFDFGFRPNFNFGRSPTLIPDPSPAIGFSRRSAISSDFLAGHNIYEVNQQYRL